jgi:hypothetical protein
VSGWVQRRRTGSWTPDESAIFGGRESAGACSRRYGSCKRERDVRQRDLVQVLVLRRGGLT